MNVSISIVFKIKFFVVKICSVSGAGLPGLGPIEEPTSPALMSWRLQGAGLAAGLETLLQGGAMGMYPVSHSNINLSKHDS